MLKIFIYFIFINTLVSSFAGTDKKSSSVDAEKPATPEEEILYILENNMAGEDDFLHEKTVENAGEIVIDTEDKDTELAWRALYIVEQGLNKSQVVQEEAVSTLGEVIRNIQDPELLDQALSLLEGHLQYASEEVFIEIIQVAEKIVKNVEDNEIAQRALSIIIQGMDEESDRTQERALKSLARIVKADSKSNIALQAMAVIEDGKMIKSESVIETLVYYVPRQLVFVDNPEIVDRALSLLEWGMFQSESAKIAVVRRASRIFEDAEGETRDRVFSILQKGATYHGQVVRDRTIQEVISILEDTESEDSKQMLLDFLQQEQVDLNENQSTEDE